MEPTDPRLHRFAGRDTTRLELSYGDYLIVRAQLTHGMQQEARARMYVANGDGALHVNPFQVGLAIVVAYLVDWSIVDAAGAPVPIRDLTPEALAAVVNELTDEMFIEVRDAIEAHADAMAAARAAQKKTLSGNGGSEATSPSPSAAAGALSGSVN